MTFLKKLTSVFMKRAAPIAPIYQDRFGTYICNVNSEVASIFLNLGLFSAAPMKDKHCLLWVFVYLQNPRHDGLSASEEAPTLYAIEDRLNAELNQSCNAIPCGRITTLGRREFYFYASSDAGFTEAANAVFETHPSYEFSMGHQPDPTWNQYLNVLYPPPDALNLIANWEVLDSLAKSGDIPSISRKVDHFIRLRTRQSVQACRTSVEAEGFLFDSEREQGGKLPFTLRITRHQSIESAQIDATTRRLRQISALSGGEYDGWGCVATSSETNS